MAEAAKAHGNTISFRLLDTRFDLMLALDRKSQGIKQKLKKINEINWCFGPSGDIFRLWARRVRPPAEVSGASERPTCGERAGNQRGRDGAAAGRSGGHRDPGGGEHEGDRWGGGGGATISSVSSYLYRHYTFTWADLFRHKLLVTSDTDDGSWGHFLHDCAANH